MSKLSSLAFYFLKAIIFKLFSLNRFTMNCYRKLGNLLSPITKRDINISTWVGRGNLLIELCKKHECLKSNYLVFELGTGWLHWYSIYIRIFNNVSISMFDIWDNRQWQPFRAAVKKLLNYQYKEEESLLVKNFTKIVSASSSFEELYQTLDLKYVISEKGSLTSFSSNSFDLIISFHVLEHIEREIFDEVIGDLYRILKPNGMCIHQIGLDDHLAHGTKLNSKQYLTYSDNLWSLLFNNKVQYINRFQMSDYLNAFEKVGFMIIEKLPTFTQIKDLKIHEQFLKYSEEDLNCEGLTLVLQK